MAGVIGTEIGAKNLCLTHFSPKHSNTTNILELISEAKQVYNGNVFAAEDYLSVDISPKRVKE